MINEIIINQNNYHKWYQDNLNKSKHMIIIKLDIFTNLKCHVCTDVKLIIKNKQEHIQYIKDYIINQIIHTLEQLNNLYNNAYEGSKELLELDKKLTKEEYFYIQELLKNKNKLKEILTKWLYIIFVEYSIDNPDTQKYISTNQYKIHFFPTIIPNLYIHKIGYIPITNKDHFRIGMIQEEQYISELNYLFNHYTFNRTLHHIILLSLFELHGEFSK